MLERLFVNLSSGLVLTYLGLYAIPELKKMRAEAKEKERQQQERIEEYEEKIKKIRSETEKLRADNKARSEALGRRVDTQQLTQLWHDIKSKIANESSIGYIDDITTVDIKRSGKLLFTVHVHPISEKDFTSARLLATNDGELDVALFNSGIIYLATCEEDRKEIWDNIEIRQHFKRDGEETMAPVETIDRLLTVGEKFKLTEVIMKISGMNQDDEEAEEEVEPEQVEGKDGLRPCPICHAEVNAELECWPGYRKLTIVCEKCGLRFENSQDFSEVMTAGGKYHYIPTTPDPVEIWNRGVKGD